MLKNGDLLDLNRCPHCGVNSPNLSKITHLDTYSKIGGEPRRWFIYVCNRCGGVVTASNEMSSNVIIDLYPEAKQVDESIPIKAARFLSQALESLHVPSGAVMLAASAVDAMLKDMEYVDGSLYNRIDQATADHLITEGMKDWAHKVRLDANNERHADVDAILATPKEGKLVVDFAMALAEFLYVLPAKVTEGIEETGKNDADNG